jgi:NAD(P)-dependent dehydrogenase (short-subunit alcohol dehydrogenase family)
MNKTKRVMLLGVTGGVGEAVADAVLDKGYDLIVTCRSEAQRKALQETGRYRYVVLLDLSSNASIDAAFDELNTLGVDSLDALVNCAARLHGTPLEFVSDKEVHELFQANVFGTLRAVQRAIPMLRKTGGRIVLVGSLAGSFVMPMTGAYSASKFALEGIADALRRELYPWGIKVSLIKPGAIDTRMFRDHLRDVTREREALTGDQKLYEPLYRAHERSIPKTRRFAVSTQKVARDVLKALTATNPAARYFPGIDSKITGIAVRIVPDSFQDWFSKKAFRLE